MHLAHHGFVVGLSEHPFNNRTDNTWFGKADNLAARPRHLGLALDYCLGPSPFASFLKPAALTSPAFAPSQDVPGFDRPQSHQTMNKAITIFLEKELV